MKIIKFKLEDKQQDFLEITLNKDYTLSGYSPMFANKRISMIGIGTLDGMIYKTTKEFIKNNIDIEEDIYIYIKTTGATDPLPWKAKTINYKVIKII